MFALLPEIDTKKTIQQAKRKLREYPVWREIARDRFTQKVTASYSFEPRQAHGRPSRPVERLAISRVDAQMELEDIEQAVNQIIQPIKRRILYEKYLKDEPSYDYEIYQELGYESARYYELLDEALLSFANCYDSEKLVVWQNRDGA